MKLGVFGDSFADIRTYDNGWEYNFSWPTLLTQMLGCETDYYGQAGTSIFWSYEKFVKNYQKYTHVVFTYTYPWRWPYLHPDLMNFHFSYSRPQAVKNLSKDKKDIFAMLDKASPYIMNNGLLEFVAKNVVRNVNYICKQHNIKLVNLVVPDNQFNIYNKEDLLFSTLEDINWVSGKLEKIIIDNNSYDMTTLCGKGLYDYRWCHMLEPNNKIVAKYLFDLFDKSEHIHAKTINEWAVNDPKMDLLYNK